jgi:mono/diheme cytochrome c family protein
VRPNAFGIHPADTLSATTVTLNRHLRRWTPTSVVSLVRGFAASALTAGLVAWAGAAQHSTAEASKSLLTPSLAGRDIFLAYCAPCHGREATGNGPVASSLKKAPANLTLLARRNGGTFPRSDVEAFVTNGRPEVGAHGSSDMPVWGPTFRSLEPSDRLVAIRIKSVVDYIASIQVK